MLMGDLRLLDVRHKVDQRHHQQAQGRGREGQEEQEVQALGGKQAAIYAGRNACTQTQEGLQGACNMQRGTLGFRGGCRTKGEQALRRDAWRDPGHQAPMLLATGTDTRPGPRQLGMRLMLSALASL